MTLIAATEMAPAPGTEAIGWVLLTNLVVRDFEEAAEKVQGYGRRWGSETWHKVLKSGCKVEDCMLEEAERLKRYLTLFSIIGVRLLGKLGGHLGRKCDGEPGVLVLWRGWPTTRPRLRLPGATRLRFALHGA